MANSTIEIQGLLFRAYDNGDGTYNFVTHDISGGTGVADSSIEIQGTRILAHDNGDGTYSIATTTSTGPNDITVEIQGLRMKLHPTGGTVMIDGVSCLLYAVNVTAV